MTQRASIPFAWYLHELAMLAVLAVFTAPVPALAAPASLPDSSSNSPASSPISSLSVVVGGFPRLIAHCDAHVYSLEYDRGYSAQNALVLRASAVPYRYDDNLYQENGHMRGVDVGARHYHGAEGAGLYTGASLGYWTSDWSFMRVRYPALPQGTAHSRSLRLNLELGDRIALGDSGAFIAPQLNVGRFFSSSTCTYTGPAAYVGTPCTQASEVQGYYFVGLGAGMMF